MSNGLTPPADVTDSWPPPNFVDPELRGPGLLVVNIVFSAIALVMTALRLYARAFITATIGLDDYLIVLALAFGIAMCTASSIAAARYGWDRHQWDVRPEWISTSLKYHMLFEMTYAMSSTLTKVSLLWFCRRLLGNSVKGSFRYLNWSLIGSMAILIILGLLFVFTTLLNCIPISANFDVNPTYPYHCINGGNVATGASCINVFTDFMATVVPMPLIWKLKLPRRQRLAVISIFGIGLIVTVASSIRTYYTWIGALGSYDNSWWGWASCLAASLEINFGLMCASAPALRPFIKAISPRILGGTGYGDKYSQQLNNHKPWVPSTTRSTTSHVRMGPNDSTTKEVGGFGRRGSSNDAGIIRTVELQTFYEDHNDATHGRPGTAPKPRGYFKDRRRDSFPASRNLNEDDEAPFALRGMGSHDDR